MGLVKRAENADVWAFDMLTVPYKFHLNMPVERVVEEDRHEESEGVVAIPRLGPQAEGDEAREDVRTRKRWWVR